MYNLIFDPWKKNKNLIASNSDEKNAYQKVLSLVDGLKGKGYIIYYDIWYSSIILTIKLIDLGVKTIKTIRRGNKKKYKIVF